MLKLEWSDLLVENVTTTEAADWLTPWSFLISGRVAPIFLNRFGSWFLLDVRGQVVALDVLSGSVSTVAPSFEEFSALVNTLEWQGTHLLSKAVYDLHLAGKVPGPRQAYALTPHPLLGGPNPASWDAAQTKWVMVMDMGIWQSICRQTVAGPDAT